MTLPDLDTSTIGYIAYYNIVEQGGLSQDFDISEILDAGSVTSQTLYDNGVEGVYNGYNGSDINIRGKQDGWILAWYPSGYGEDSGDVPDWSEGLNSASDVQGRWDLANGWADYDAGSTNLTQNSLERCIQDLQSQLSNSAGITYNPGDVGLYNYSYPDATTVLQTHVQRSVGDNSVSVSLGLTKTAGTTIYDLWQFSAMEGSGGGNPSDAYVQGHADGDLIYETRVPGSDNNTGTGYAARDLLFLNYSLTAGQQFSIELVVSGNGSGVGANGNLHNLAVWG